MPGDTLTKEELLLVEKMLDKRVPDIDGERERAYQATDWKLPQAQRRLIARNAVLAELLKTGPIPVTDQEFNYKTNMFTGERSGVKASPAKAEEPKESPFDSKPRLFTLEDV